jgi:hypothetical protein
MGEDLFGRQDLTRQQKTKASRKITSDLTKDVIDWMNESMQFKVHRSNNIPSPIIKRETAFIDAFDQEGNPKQYPYEKITTMFRKNNIKEKILDISGIVLVYNGNDIWAGKHVEIESKVGKDSLSEGQIERIKLIKQAGGISFVFSDWKTFLFQIKPYMVERKLAF